MCSHSQNCWRRDKIPELVSVVIPAFNEEGNIELIYEEISRVLNEHNWELIIVDDGSSDDTFLQIAELAEKDPRVKGVSFSRNFGHQNALLAGITESLGEVVVTMDGDMQHPSSLIPELINEWQNGSNIVHTRRISVGTGVFKRVTSNWFYRIFSALTGIPLTSGQSDFRLTDRKVVDVLTNRSSGPLFFRGTVHSIGFRHSTVEFEVGERHSGVSKYSIRKMFKFAAHGITAFSTLPLRLGIRIGFLTSFFAFAELIYILVMAIRGDTVPGWASVAGLVSLLFGINFVLIGFLGIYIGHIFHQTRSNPLYIVENRTYHRTTETKNKNE